MRKHLVVLLSLVVVGCVSVGPPNETQQQIFPESVTNISVRGSGGIWTETGPVLVDRYSGAVSVFEEHNEERVLITTHAPDYPIRGSYGATGVAAGDINGDGQSEFFITAQWGAPQLLRYNGETMEDITTAAGITREAGFQSSFSSAFVDIDGDGDLDLYIGQSASFAEIQLACEVRTIVPCVAQRAVGDYPNLLFRNDGQGKFTEVPDALGANHPGATLGLAFADLDLDDDLDLYLANDFGPDVLYRNDHGLFVDVTHESGVWPLGGGMGVAVGDLNKDGRPDIYVTHYGRDTILLNDGNMHFTDSSAHMGVLDYSDGTVGWGVILEDMNRDGWLDAVVARGSWDPDATHSPEATQPAYTIALNRTGVNFALVQQGTIGVGAWGLASNGNDCILVLSPFSGGSVLAIRR